MSAPISPQDDPRAVSLRVVLREPGSTAALCEASALIWVTLPPDVADQAPVGTQLAGRVDLAAAT